MSERCGTAPTLEELEAEYERARQARIDEYDCSFSSRQLAAKLVDTEDELGSDVDGICTGMHADVAEAHCEIERLNGLVERFEGWRAAIYDVARSSFRAAGKSRRSAARYRLAWLSARRRAAEEANLGAEAVEHIAADRDRWQRGHERAEAQLHTGRRANAQLHQELERVRAKLRDVRAYALERCTEPYTNEASASWVLHLLGDDLRKSTHGASMESVGDVDGDTVWRLKSAEDF